MNSTSQTSNPEVTDLQQRYGQLLGALRRVKRRLALIRLTSLLVDVLVLVPCALLLAMAADLVFGLAPLSRLIMLLAAAVAVSVMIVWRRGVPIVRTLLLSRHDLAHRLEAHFPELESRVVTLLDLYPKLDRESDTAGTAMIALAIRSAAQEIAGRELTSMASFRQLKNQYRALAGVVLLVGLLFGINSQGMLQRLQRFATIGHEMRLARAYIDLTAEVVETDTVTVITEGSDAVDVAAISGSDIQLAVSAASSEPAPLKLHRRAADADAFTTTLIDADAETVDLGAVEADVECYLSLGDVETPRFRIESTDYPEVETVQIRYSFPPYTRMSPEFLPQSDGHISVLHMAEAEVTVVSDKPLSSAVFEVYGRRVAARVHGRRATTRFQISADGEYSLELTDRHQFTMTEPFRRSIESIADQPPEVTVEAADELLLTADQVDGVSVKLEAQDDYGIAAVRLAYRISSLPDVRLENERDDRRRESEHLPEPPRRKVSLDYPAGFGNLDLQIGEVVTYWVEADDTDDVRGPNSARSREFRLVVVAEELKTWAEIEDEDRWPSSLRSLLTDSSKQSSAGIRRLGRKLVRSDGEEPRSTSDGVSDAAEGYIAPELRDGFSDYSKRIEQDR